MASHAPPARTTADGRLGALDAQRGIAILFMVLVHAGFFTHVSLSAERFVDFRPAVGPFPWWAIGLLCNLSAPTFWVLSGASLRLLTLRNLRLTGSERGVRRFMLVRAVLFVLLDLTVVPLFWRPLHGFAWAYEFELLSSLAVSMLLLGPVLRLPGRVLLALMLVLLVGYQWLAQAVPPALRDAGGFPLRLLLFHDVHALPPVDFPVLGWMPLMGIGYVLGGHLRRRVLQRPRTWVWVGLALHALWLTLRVLGVYGDCLPFHRGDPWRDFLILCEGPPGLVYFGFTLGNGALCYATLLALGRRLERAPWSWLGTLGRASFFSYVLHLPLYKLLGHAGLKLLPGSPGLRWTLVTAAGLAVMVPAGRVYRRLKERHHSGVLRYF